MNKILIIFWVIALSVAIFGYLLIDEKQDYLYGLFVSLINTGIALGVYYLKRKQIPRYPAQALVIVISTTLMRFMIIGGLLIYGFTRFGGIPEPLLLGFVIGQIFFLINQLITVVTSDGK